MDSSIDLPKNDYITQLDDLRYLYSQSSEQDRSRHMRSEYQLLKKHLCTFLNDKRQPIVRPTVEHGKGQALGHYRGVNVNVWGVCSLEIPRDVKLLRHVGFRYHDVFLHC